MIRASLKWMFLIIGTTIGAGYASGRELWQFFGHESGLAILLFVIFFSTSCYVIMKVSYEKQSTHYFPVLHDIIGGRLSRIYDVLIFLYLCTTTIVMIAGSGAAGQAYHLSEWWGIIFIILALIGLFMKGLHGLLSINQYLVPLLLIGLLSILLLYSFDQDLNWFSNWQEQKNWFAAFPFTALNILPLVAVLGAIGNKIRVKEEIWFASIGSGLILGFITFVYNQSLMHIAKEINMYEIPLFAILKDYSFSMLICMTIVLWLAIFTTAAAGLLGIATRLREIFSLSILKIVMIVLICMLPFTIFSFSGLIRFLYPLYGMLNLYLLIKLLLYPVWNLFDK